MIEYGIGLLVETLQFYWESEIANLRLRLRIFGLPYKHYGLMVNSPF